MEKFFQVKGTTGKKLEEVILKVGVIPVLIIALPTIVFGKEYAIEAISIAIAAIYLLVFYFKTLMK